MFPGECGIVSVVSPPHGSETGINPRKSQKGSWVFFPRTLSSPHLEDFISATKVQFLSMRQSGTMQISTERLGLLCENVAFPSGPPDSVLGEFNQRPHPQEVGWLSTSVPNFRGPEVGQDPEQEGD